MREAASTEWMGALPPEWTTARISSLYTPRNEKVSEDDYPALSVTMQGIVPQLETAAKSQDTENRKLVRTGDFVINSRSDRRGSCGIARQDGSVSLISNVLNPIDANSMDPEFFEFLFKTEGFADEYYKWGTGIVDDLWSTNWSRMKNIMVAYPSYDDQKMIAKYLDQKTAEIDLLIGQTERSIELLEEYRKSVISEAVTKGLDPDAPMKDSGIEWIGKIPESWTTPKLKYISRIESGATPDRENHSYWDGTIPWIKTGELQNGKTTKALESITERALDETSVKLFPQGTVLVAMYGQGKTRGMTSLLEIEACTNQACAGIQPDQKVIVPEFLQLFMIASYDAIRLTALGSGQPNLSLDLIGDWAVCIPPLYEQAGIVCKTQQVMSHFDQLLDCKRELLTALQDYRKSLIFEAVTGKFKVPGVM